MMIGIIQPGSPLLREGEVRKYGIIIHAVCPFCDGQTEIGYESESIKCCRCGALFNGRGECRKVKEKLK